MQSENRTRSKGKPAEPPTGANSMEFGKKILAIEAAFTSRREVVHRFRQCTFPRQRSSQLERLQILLIGSPCAANTCSVQWSIIEIPWRRMFQLWLKSNGLKSNRASRLAGKSAHHSVIFGALAGAAVSRATQTIESTSLLRGQ